MRGAAVARCLARRFLSSKPPPPASQLAQAKLNLTLAERVAGSAARSDAEARAANYVRRRARAQQPAGDEASPEAFSRPEGALAPLEDGDPRRAYLAEPPPEGGLAGVAELRIRAAQRQGDFDNLRLCGAPLEDVLDPHEATHFADHGGAIAARILKAANYKCDLRVACSSCVRCSRARIFFLAQACEPRATYRAGRGAARRPRRAALGGCCGPLQPARQRAWRDSGGVRRRAAQTVLGWSQRDGESLQQRGTRRPRVVRRAVASALAARLRPGARRARGRRRGASGDA